MRLAFICVSVGVFTLAACGDDPTGPVPPNLVGTYDGTWTVTVEGPGIEPTADVCGGAVTVGEQSGGTFQGTYSQTADADCDAANGFVTGTVTADGEISVLLGASGGGGPGFEESTGCTIQSAENRYTGSFIDGTLSFDTSLTAVCPDTGDVTVTWTFAFEGSWD